MPTPSEVMQLIYQTALEEGIDPILALATVQNEGGFDPSGRGWTVGGDDGQSWGPFQEHIRGRGARNPRDTDPVGQTRRFAADIRRLQETGFRGSPGELIAAAQRPYNQQAASIKYQASYDKFRSNEAGQNQGSMRAIPARGQQAQQLGLAGGTNMPGLTYEQAMMVIRNTAMIRPDLLGIPQVAPRRSDFPGMSPGDVNKLIAQGNPDANRAMAEQIIRSTSQEGLIGLAEQVLRKANPQYRITLSGSVDIAERYNQEDRDRILAEQQAKIQRQFGLPPPETAPTGAPTGGAVPGELPGYRGGVYRPHDLPVGGFQSIQDFNDWLFEHMTRYEDYIAANPNDELANAVYERRLDLAFQLLELSPGSARNIPYGQTQEAFERNLEEDRRQFGITSAETNRANIEREKQNIRAELARLQAGRGEAELRARTELAPITLPPGTEYVPGYEPGGAGSQIFSRLGLQHQPIRTSQTQVAQPPTSGENALARALSLMGGGSPGLREWVGTEQGYVPPRRG